MNESDSRATRILIVEDNGADVRIIRMALAAEKDWPLEISVADDGEKAIAYLCGHPPYQEAVKPDLVILDLNLPKYDGTQVLQTIRATEQLRSLAVVILSSAPETVLKEKVHKAGVTARGYLTKPLEFGKWMVLGREIRRYYTDGESDAT